MNENNEISYIFEAFRALYFILSRNKPVKNFYVKVCKTVIYIKISLYFSL